MTVLEDRLRSELRAESELIAPGSIAPLRLPGQTKRTPFAPWRSGPRQWPPWVAPLAAAAAAAAVIAGTFGLAHVLQGSGPRPANPKLSSLPAYYAYTVQGPIYHYVSHGTDYGESVNGRYVKVRDTATGNLLATISPAKPYNDFQLLSANAAGTMFVLGAAHNWDRNAHTPASVTRRNPTTPMKFWELRIGPGRQTHLSSLSLPITVTPGQSPSIALSPDGAQLAVTFGGGGQPAVLEVVSLGTGRTRRWASPPVRWTPMLGQTGAWTADGNIVALQQWDVIRAASAQAAPHRNPPTATPVYLIRTTAPGHTLAAGKLLVLHSPAHEQAPWQVVLTPDATKLIAVTGKQAFPRWRGTSSGQLSVYSAQTGAMIERLAPWTWHAALPGHGGLPVGAGLFPRPTIALSSPSGSELIIVYPQRDRNILGVLTSGRFRATGAPLPARAGYRELQGALLTANYLAW